MLIVDGLRSPRLEPARFEIVAGECVIVAGPSGSGKSLLLRAIADLDPNEGAIFLDGCRREDMSAPAWRRRVVYVATDAGWWADEVGAHFADRAAAARLLAELGLETAALTWSVARLSTGERQRLALARALAIEPPLLLLDEPTSGLDGESVLKAERLFRRHLARGGGILLVSHDRAQADRLGRRRLAMANGSLAEDAAWPRRAEATVRP